MNQPTEDRIKHLEEEQKELKEAVRKLQEQMTEPITIPRIELDPGGIQNRLDNHAEIMKEISQAQKEQEEQLVLIYTDVGHMKTDVGKLKGDMGEVKAIVANLKATQSDHSEMLKEIKTAMATRDDLVQLRNEMKSETLAMKNEILDTMKQLLQQKQSE